MSELNELTERLNKLLLAVQTIWAQNPTQAAVQDCGWKLEFKKHGDEWQLVWTANKTQALTPLLRASRQDRMIAARNLYRLHARMVENKTQLVKELQAVNKSLEEFVDLIEKQT